MIDKAPQLRTRHGPAGQTACMPPLGGQRPTKPGAGAHCQVGKTPKRTTATRKTRKQTAPEAAAGHGHQADKPHCSRARKRRNGNALGALSGGEPRAPNHHETKRRGAAWASCRQPRTNDTASRKPNKPKGPKPTNNNQKHNMTAAPLAYK